MVFRSSVAITSSRDVIACRAAVTLAGLARSMNPVFTGFAWMAISQ
jgi:hypothetical protein